MRNAVQARPEVKGDFSAALAAFDGRVRLLRLREVREPRGRLIAVDHAALPFAVRRSFIVDDVPAGTVRGGHAHRECEQVLACLEGCVRVSLTFDEARAEIVLTDNAEALYIGPGVWSEQHYEANARLLVFASHPFDPDSYVGADSPQCLKLHHS